MATATLKSPDGHHNWLVDFQGLDQTEKVRLRSHVTQVAQYSPCFSEPMDWSVLRAASPFIQGDQGDWMRIEFWSENQSILLSASEALAKLLGLPLEIA